MRLFGLNRRRSNTLLLLVAQLVLIAYVFQVAAFDHWDVDVGEDVAGVADSSAHAAVHGNHCHGSPASCAEAGGGFAQVDPGEAFRLPAQRPTAGFEILLEIGTPFQAYVAAIAEPPRASA
jgi:hypothetical protein